MNVIIINDMKDRWSLEVGVPLHEYAPYGVQKEILSNCYIMLSHI
jgi:hypothetical protein